MNFDKKVLYIEAEYPEINFDFEYDIDGKILMLPITGKGPGLMHTGKEHRKSTNFKFTF